MENISKALLIAAEVLVGMLILSVAVLVITSYRGVQEEYNETTSAQQVEAFNNQFLKYVEYDHGNRYITAQNLITIANLAKEIKEKEKIEVIIKIGSNVVTQYGNTTTSIMGDGKNEDATKGMYVEKTEEGKKISFPIYYKITNITTDAVSGRIKGINVQQKFYKYENSFKQI